MAHCEHKHQHREAGPAEVKDPVCGMTVDPAKTPHHAMHAGHEWYFCSDKCRVKFMADPEHYLKPAVTIDAPASIAVQTSASLFKPPPKSMISLVAVAIFSSTFALTM